MVLKICEACGRMEEISDEKHDIYGVCEHCITDNQGKTNEVKSQ